MDYHLSIQLNYTPAKPAISLRAINGFDELSIRNSGTADALILINRLTGYDNHLSNSMAAEKMVTADRDRLLALLYKETYGQKIESVRRCKECNELFHINFYLSELERHVQDTEDIAGDEDGIYHTEAFGFRLPTGEDELAIAGMPSERAVDELLSLCLIRGERNNTIEIEKAMSLVAPVLQTEIKSACPACGVLQESRFDIQSYLLGKLKQEQKILIQDVHSLASHYKWSHAEIMELPHRLRKMYVAVINGETPAL